MAMRVACVFVIAASACRPARKSPEESCLALPAAIRADLTASPDGQSILWLERTRNYDFDGDLHASWRLVQYDLRTHRTDPIFDHASGPIHFLDGQLLAIQDSTSWRIVLRARDGHTQELTPPSLDVIDFEVLDGNTIAFLADGTGARAVYLLDLREQRPSHLIDADVLLSAVSGRVFARTDDDVLVVDVKTRASTKIPYIKRSQPQAERLVHVDNGAVVAYDMVTQTSQPLVTTARKWKLVYQGDTVLARSAPKDGHSYAYVISASSVQALPTVLGGASIIRTTQLADQTWALVGHNTTNFIGDLADTTAEVDVCRLPKSADVTYPTRQVPARFTEMGSQLFDALEPMSPGATLGIMDNADDPVTLLVDLKKEIVGRDLNLMRKRARDVHDSITRLFHDAEIRTEVMFEDHRLAICRWKRDRLRTRISVGMGDALLADPADFDFEVSKLANEKKEGKITCSGTLRNLTHRALDDVEIRCSGNRSHLIHVGKLAVDESHPFSQVFDVSEDGENPFVEIRAEGKASEPLDADDGALANEVFMLATDTFAATGLWLLSHDVGESRITVDLRAEDSFLDRQPADQQAAVTAAYTKYLELRRIYGVEDARPLRVRVDVELGDDTFEYDGTRFSHD